VGNPGLLRYACCASCTHLTGVILAGDLNAEGYHNPVHHRHCTDQQCMASMKAIAKAHACAWKDKELRKLPLACFYQIQFKRNLWILERGVRTFRATRRGDGTFDHSAVDRVMQKWKLTFAEFGDEKVVAMVHALHAHYNTKIMARVYALPWDVYAHGDNQLRNHLYKYKKQAEEGGEVKEPPRYKIDGVEPEREVEDVALIDWSLSGLAPAVFDVLYFQYASRIPADPEFDEKCLQIYHQQLTSSGTVKYEWETLLGDYRASVLHMVVAAFVDMDFTHPAAREVEIKSYPPIAKWFESNDQLTRRVLNTATWLHQQHPELLKQ